MAKNKTVLQTLGFFSKELLTVVRVYFQKPVGRVSWKKESR